MLSYGGLRTDPFTKVFCLGIPSINWDSVNYAPSRTPSLADYIYLSEHYFLSCFPFFFFPSVIQTLGEHEKDKNLLVNNKDFLASVLCK